MYGKAGVGFANISSSVIDACNTSACGGGLLTTNYSSTQAFWVAGGGLEYAFNNSWSVKGEYLFLGIDKTYAGLRTRSRGGDRLELLFKPQHRGHPYVQGGCELSFQQTCGREILISL